jgi:hypothetical protein
MTKDKIQNMADELWEQYADEHDGWQTTMNYKSFCNAIHLTVVTVKDKIAIENISDEPNNIKTKLLRSVICRIPTNVSYPMLEAKCSERKVICNYTDKPRIVELLSEDETSIRNVIVTLNIKTIN